MKFRERLEELINRFSDEDIKHKVSIDIYFRYRVQAKHLLTQSLGEDHIYTKELQALFTNDMDQYSVGSYLFAAKGILMALAEDIDNGFVHMRDEQ